MNKTQLQLVESTDPTPADVQRQIRDLRRFCGEVRASACNNSALFYFATRVLTRIEKIEQTLAGEE